ncbi:hypothetical protein B4073_0378 [Bacillus subtilis]|uniref:Uncharacterized protein n=2 Tax=Bacillus subtilis TaxID=1423 RepID=A0A0C3HZW2_BACIU|nr:hypothetical protein [Bacillus subtilis]KIL29357.1 hypothetical protein B4067_0347 [Bacillus subtilis subsp. subtilis]KIN27152.1 hypothetical protein B4070_0407 [Bacillus subtilis]KIN27987.1 hypothetical protein B4069_0355 [Bacillus subtilis]KIN32824.1 hypothetical protein B4068_0182 [Bacillus subtilis]KIN34825.1 hypothetical protein B4071_0346 [Bacillus subtilis]
MSYFIMFIDRPNPKNTQSLFSGARNKPKRCAKKAAASDDAAALYAIAVLPLKEGG